MRGEDSLVVNFPNLFLVRTMSFEPSKRRPFELPHRKRQAGQQEPRG